MILSSGSFLTPSIQAGGILSSSSRPARIDGSNFIFRRMSWVDFGRSPARASGTANTASTAHRIAAAPKRQRSRFIAASWIACAASPPVVRPRLPQRAAVLLELLDVEIVDPRLFVLVLDL